MTVRNVFIVSPLKRVRVILSYPAYVGRNFNEILRVLDALQLSAKHPRVATPANWHPGDDTVVLPFISDEEAERVFADQGGVRKERSYLRYRARSVAAVSLSYPQPLRSPSCAHRGRRKRASGVLVTGSGAFRPSRAAFSMASIRSRCSASNQPASRAAASSTPLRSTK